MPIAPFTMSCNGVQLTKAATDTTAAQYTVTLVPFGTANTTVPKVSPLLLITDEATAAEFVAGKEYDITIAETP